MELTLQNKGIKIEIPDANLWRAVIDQAIEDLSQRCAEQRWTGSPRLRTSQEDFAGPAITPIWTLRRYGQRLEKPFATLESVFLRYGLNQPSGMVPTTTGQCPIGLGTVVEHGCSNPVLLIIRTTTRDRDKVSDSREQLPIDHVRFSHLPIG